MNRGALLAGHQSLKGCPLKAQPSGSQDMKLQGLGKLQILVARAVGAASTRRQQSALAGSSE